MRYESFAILIKPAAGDEGYVTYVACPAGETQERLILRDGLIDRCRRLVLLPKHPAQGQPVDAQEVGRQLFEALLPGAVGAMFHESLARLGSSQGLRLELRLDLGDPRLVAVAALPWEYLYSDRLGGFLALRRRTPIVRYVEVPRPSTAPPVPRVLRVLVLAAHPRSLGAPLDLAAEREQIEAAWAGLDDVEMSFVDATNREGLAGALRDGVRTGRPHHVLHFMGHGRTDPKSGRGELLLESDRGLPVPVGGEQLARELADFLDLRLVVLNACETGTVSAGTGDAFGGVASALVRVGVQAVVAMQKPITDRAAIELCRVLYERLAAGDALDTAVGESRLALDRRKETAHQWAVPVLFMRLPDGRLFTPRTPRTASRRARRVAVAGVAAALASVAVIVPALRSGDPCEEDPAPQVQQLAESAQRHAAAGRYERAAQLLRDALGLEPRFAGAYSALAFVELERGRYPAARASLARAARELPLCALHAYNLGSFHLLREEYEQAAESLGRALELDPERAASYAALGRTLYLLGGFEEAAAVLEEGIRRVEGNQDESGSDVTASLHANLGRVFLATGQPERAVSHLERAHALLPADDPRRRELVPPLASSRAAAGDTAAACRDLSSVLPLHRSPLTPWEARALELEVELGCAAASSRDG